MDMSTVSPVDDPRFYEKTISDILPEVVKATK